MSTVKSLPDVPAVFILAALSHQFLERPVRTWAHGVDIAHEPVPSAIVGGDRLAWNRFVRRRSTIAVSDLVDFRPLEVEESAQESS